MNDDSIIIRKAEQLTNDQGECIGVQLHLDDVEKPIEITLEDLLKSQDTLPGYELRRLEIKEDLTMGERLYCVIQDLEDYIMHNNLEQDKELDFIWRQLDTIKEIYDESSM